MEKATVKIDERNTSSREVMSCFAQIFSSLDENPRKLLVTVVAEAAGDKVVSVDFTPQGKMVFYAGTADSTCADFRSRWIPEHPVPLSFAKRKTRLFFRPVDGNRVKVRKASFLEGIFNK